VATASCDLDRDGAAQHPGRKIVCAGHPHQQSKMRNHILEAEGSRSRRQHDTDYGKLENLTNDGMRGRSCHPKTFSDTHDWELRLSFQRLANFDNGALDRLGRYESRLWRQTVQICFFSGRAKCI
jgi:hypothetical protein